MGETNNDWPRVAATKQVIMHPDEGTNEEAGACFKGGVLELANFRALGNSRKFNIRRPVEIFLARYETGQVFVAEFLERPIEVRKTILVTRLRGVRKLVAKDSRLKLVGPDSNMDEAQLAFLSKRKLFTGDMKQSIDIPATATTIRIRAERLWAEGGEAYRLLEVSFS